MKAVFLELIILIFNRLFMLKISNTYTSRDYHEGARQSFTLWVLLFSEVWMVSQMVWNLKLLLRKMWAKKRG